MINKTRRVPCLGEMAEWGRVGLLGANVTNFTCMAEDEDIFRIA